MFRVCSRAFRFEAIGQCHFKSSIRQVLAFPRRAFTLRARMIIRRTRRACTTPFFHVIFSKLTQGPLVSLQAPLSVFFALSRLSFFPPRNTPFRTDYRTDYIRKDLIFASSLRFVEISKIKEQYMKINSPKINESGIR